MTTCTAERCNNWIWAACTAAEAQGGVTSSPCGRRTGCAQTARKRECQCCWQRMRRGSKLTRSLLHTQAYSLDLPTAKMGRQVANVNGANKWQWSGSCWSRCRDMLQLAAGGGGARRPCQCAMPSADQPPPAQTLAAVVALGQGAQRAAPAACPAGRPTALVRPWAAPAPGRVAGGLGRGVATAVAARAVAAVAAAAVAAAAAARLRVSARAPSRDPAAAPGGKPPILAGSEGRVGKAHPRGCSCVPARRPPLAPV